ncbi:hypothetical protein CDV36_009106 [Fusarium kuroshium]|uniref:Mid2 domain-containing protein n=2 Tax=Fusarium solani species complex TaxID=232080 RepID=A0A3M2S133_9HYPO|nr:hypothetical protein CDV36_009106 [Fusarium kuroshium]RSL75398.1 hypothetical protein CEP51_010899 [Fusarium floridanum]
MPSSGVFKNQSLTMASRRDILAADVFPPEIDKLMAASDYPTSPLFAAASSKGRPVRWTSKTVTSSNSIYVTAVPDDEDNRDFEGSWPVVTLTTMITVTDPFSQETLFSLPPTRPTTRTTTMAAETTPRNMSSSEPTLSVETSVETSAETSVDSDVAAPPTSIDHRSHGLSQGLIAAIAVGTALALTVMILMAWICIRHRRKQCDEDNSTISQNNSMPILRPPSLPPLPELSSHAERTDTPNDSLLSCSILSDPRETLSQGVRSPTPQPAVAEVRSFTRTWQKPRVYTVGERGTSEPQGLEPVGSPLGRSHDSSPVSPTSGTDSTYPGSHVVSPLSPPSRYGSLSPWDSGGREEGQGGRF